MENFRDNKKNRIIATHVTTEKCHINVKIYKTVPENEGTKETHPTVRE